MELSHIYQVIKIYMHISLKNTKPTFTEQGHNKKFLKTGEVSWNKVTLINNSSTTYERKTPQRIFFLLDGLKKRF